MARRLKSGNVLEVEFPKVPSPEMAWPEGGYGYLTYLDPYNKWMPVDYSPHDWYKPQDVPDEPIEVN